jgi:hypothetical protein
MYVFTTARVHVLTPSKGMLAGSERFGLIGETILKRQTALCGLWTAEMWHVCMIAGWNYGIYLAKRYVDSSLSALAPGQCKYIDPCQ